MIAQRDELEAGRGRTLAELAELEDRLHNAQQEPMFDVEFVDRSEYVRGRRRGASGRGRGPAGGADR
ncbi:hypothetical protein MAUB1S_04215 [Mycolicibacterium aubagnense]